MDAVGERDADYAPPGLGRPGELAEKLLVPSGQHCHECLAATGDDVASDPHDRPKPKEKEISRRERGERREDKDKDEDKQFYLIPLGALGDLRVRYAFFGCVRWL